MPKTIILSIALICMATLGYAQVPTNQDCDGAIPVCQNIYFQANSFSGSGNYPTEINGAISCLFTGEFNSVWYTFTVQSSGNLCFTIIPNNSGDDYDWAVYDLTNASCSDISTDASLEVSCNYDPIGGSAQTGPNGMAGLGFEPCIPVSAGETYSINLSNFTASNDGYTLDFSASTAVILDNIAPQVDSVYTPVFCGTSTLTLQFSENILCNTISPADFTLTGPGGPYTILSVDGAVCSSGGTQENVYTLNVSPPLSSAGNYTLDLTNAAGTVEDLCGNTANAASFSFPLSFIPITAGLDDTLILCSSQSSVNLSDSLMGSPDPGGIWLDPALNLFSGTYDPTTDSPGEYVYIVGSAPCPMDSAFVLVDTVPPPDPGIGGSLIICDPSPVSLFNGLSGTPTSGGSWTGPGGVISNGFFAAGSDPAGSYTYLVQAIGTCPGGSTSVTVSLNPFVSAGSNGNTTVCASDPAFDLFAILGGSPDPGGSWVDPLGNPVGSTFSPGTSLAGNYTYTVSATAPCPDPSAVVSVTVNPLPDAGNNAFIDVCTSDASFDMVTMLGGTPDPGGQWVDFSGNPVSNTFDPATGSSGPFTYTVSGNGICPDASSTLVINIFPEPIISLVSQQDLLCSTMNTGSVTVSGSGGNAPYEFAINGGIFGSANTFTGLGTGLYNIEIRDANGCINSLTGMITSPPLLTGSVTAQNDVSCHGGSDGFVTVTGAGGTPPYQYSIDGTNFFTSGTFTGLALGIYFVTVEDDNGCQITVNATVTQPEPLSVVFINQIPLVCNGDSSGGFTAQAAGGTAPYQYSLDGVNYSPASIFGNLPAGTYTIFVQDANMCGTTTPYTIAEPTAIIPTITNQTDVDCIGGSNGSISTSASGGTAPYQYSLDGNTFGASNTFTGLSAGFYTVSILDDNGCIGTVDTTVTSPTGLVGGIDSVVHLACASNNTGFAEVFAQGGTAPYQFSINGFNFSPDSTFGGLAAGNYTVSIQDANLCLITINLTIQSPPTLTLAISNQTNVACNGDSTGAITVLANGGVGTYEYSIDGVNFGSSSIFTGLPVGSYTITVRDSNQCTNTVSTILTEPPAVQIMLASLQDVDCFGNNTGIVEIEGAGGTTPYAFSMVGGSSGVSTIFPNLPAGSYAFVIEDGNLCTDSLFVSVSEPDTMIAGISSQINNICFGDVTGSVSIHTTGGTSPYSFSLDGINFNSGNTITDLSAGTYVVTVQDVNSCVDTVMVEITEPPVLDLSLLEQINVDCNGQSTGELTFSSTGGTLPYIYSFDGSNFQSDSVFIGLSAGNYLFEVTDDNGCIDTMTTLITEPAPLLAQIDTILNVSCFGDSSGMVELGAMGGSLPYQFSINSGSFGSDSSFLNLPAGSYQGMIMDDSACTSPISFAISQPPLLEISLTNQQNVDCFNGTNGMVEVMGIGGTAPYQYALDSGSFMQANSFQNLSAGSYTISVADSLNCLSTLLVNITEPDSMEGIILAQTDASCFGEADASVSVTATGGTTPYSFSLDGGLFQLSGDFDNLSPDTYQIEIQDAIGCTQTFSVELFQPDSLFASLSRMIQVDCYGNETGSFEIIGNGGISPYQYSIDGQNFQPFGEFDNLGAGLYDVNIEDANGCEAILSDVLMTEPDSILLSMIGVDVLCHGDRTGVASVDVDGGITPYSYVWDDPLAQTSESINGLGIGTYTVRITDENGCVAMDTTTIRQPEELVLSLLGQDEAYCDWENGSAAIDVIGGVGEYNIVWNSFPIQEGPILQNVFGGEYIAVAYDDNGCFDSLNVVIGSIPAARASFEFTPPGDTILLSRANLLFTNLSEGAVAYEWTFGDGITKSDLLHPTYTYEDTGIFEITLTAFDELFLCPDDTSVRITIIPDGVLYFPNAFSPNGDGYNDEFRIGGEGIVQFEIVFFNRWGREIRRYSSKENGWDGLTQNGSIAPEGVYVFVVKAVLNSGEQIEQGGSVTLLR